MRQHHRTLLLTTSTSLAPAVPLPALKAAAVWGWLLATAAPAWGPMNVTALVTAVKLKEKELSPPHLVPAQKAAALQRNVSC